MDIIDNIIVIVIVLIVDGNILKTCYLVFSKGTIQNNFKVQQQTTVAK